MDHPLHKRSAQVLLIEPQQARRAMLVDGLKALGLKQIQWASSFKDALGVMAAETHPPDWLIAPLTPEAPLNGLNFLGHLLSTDGLRQCRLSLILEEGQDYCLPTAFAAGLLSHHARHLDRAGQMAALSDLFAVGDEQGWDDTLIAAHYLRQCLKDKNRFSELERFEMRLCTMYPDHGPQAVALAEALLLTKNFHSAQLTLDRLPALTGEAANRAVQAAAHAQKALLGLDGQTGGFGAALGLNRALVVDPDESSRNIIAKALSELGIADVISCGDGLEAWELMRQKNKAPDLIIQEWRLPHLSGDMLVQRARLNGFADIPVIVHSSLVKAKDRMLLREMGVSDVIEKPLPTKNLKASLISTLKEVHRPTTVVGLERQIRAALANRQHGEARKILRKLQAMDHTAEPVRLGLNAEIEFQANHPDLAESLGIQALALGGDDVVVLNLLGKIALRRGDGAEATRYFERAQKLSPQNIGRLLFLAEARAAADDLAGAQTTVDAARAMDSGNPRVLEAAAKIAMANGDQEAARGLLAQTGATAGIVAFLNNRAVSLVGAGRTAESVDLYRTALASLPPKSKKLTTIVKYNLALALLRLGDVAGADEQLKATPPTADIALAAKLHSLATRTARALHSGDSVQLFLDEPVTAPDVVGFAGNHDGEDEAAAKTPGQRRCHLIFIDQNPDPKAAKLAEVQSGYRGSKAIQKGGAA